MRASGGGGRGSEAWRRGGGNHSSSSSTNPNRSNNGPPSQHQQQHQQHQPGPSSSSSSRGRGGRTPSTPWSRLKPVELDPLEALGLPSKGDNRLLDFKTQERYYTKIVERYMAFCSDAGERDELLRRFASLTMNSSSGNSSSSGAPAVQLAQSQSQPSLPSSSDKEKMAAQSGSDGTNKPASGGGGMSASRHAPQDTDTTKPSQTKTTAAISSSSSSSTPNSSSAKAISGPSTTTATTKSSSPFNTEEHAKSLSDVLSALRKLREGIVASKRIDNFSIQAYLFCIRLAVLSRHPESYHPAMLHLLRRVHPAHNMTTLELHEVVGYLVLDTACRRGDLAEAYALRRRYRFRDTKVDAVLDSLAHDNYVEFNRLRGHVDGHRARLLEYAEEGMRRHSLKCFGRTYLSVDLGYLERCAGSKWASLAANDGVGWELEGDKVIIKRVRAK